MDFLPALAAVMAPNPSVQGGRLRSGDAPAGMATGDFSAHMLPAGPRTHGPAQMVPIAAEDDSLSEPYAGPALGAGTAPEEQPDPGAYDSDAAEDRPDHVLRAASLRAQEIAEAAVEVAPALVASGEERPLLIGPEAAVVGEDVGAGAAGRPVAGEAGTRVAEMEQRPQAAPLTPLPEPLPSSDVPRTEADPGDSGRMHGGQAAPLSDGGEAPPQAPAGASANGLAVAPRTPARVLEREPMVAASDAARAPALSASVGAAEGRSQERLVSSGGSGIDRAAEPRRRLASADGAARLREGPAVPDDRSKSPIRIDPSAGQQLSSESPAGRSPQLSVLNSSLAGAHPATGPTGEVVTVVARAPDGPVSRDPALHPAAQQVALQIAKGLDEGRTEIRIRLDPPELGEVDIQLEFRDLRLVASVSAERADTVELLQRDARALARALREAGLELADTDLSFGQNEHHDRPDPGSYAPRAINLPHAALDAAPLGDLSLALRGPDGFVSLSDGRMDLRV